MSRSWFLGLGLAIFSVAATSAQQRPAFVDIRLSDGLRNDLAGQLIKMQQLGACDVSCHLVIAGALVALDTATPVPKDKTLEAAPTKCDTGDKSN
jgi:hypothetical protein